MADFFTDVWKSIVGFLGSFNWIVDTLDILLVAFIIYYLLSAVAFGMPLLAPFSPFVAHDLRDSLVKYNMQSLKQRPRLFRSPNKTRLKSADEKGED